MRRHKGYQWESGAQKPGTISRVARVAGNIVFYCVLALMIALVFFLVQGRLMDGPPRVFGHQLYVVVGGSMSPAFEAGSVVAVKPVDPATLAVGDIISFRTTADGMLTTHRIVGVNTEGSLRFTTMGDANNAEDPNPVSAANVVGRVALDVPYAGYVVNFAGTLYGLLLLVVVPGVLIIVFEVRNLFVCAREMDSEKALAKSAGTPGIGPGKQKEAV